jgi:hypothetical protein
MVGRHAGAHQPEGRRQQVDEVDLEPVGEQLLAGVEPGRARTDDGDALARAHV